MTEASRLVVPLSAEFQEHLTFQEYALAPAIQGVWVHPLTKHHKENGAFMEYLRLDASGVQAMPGPLQPRQLSVSWATPGRINAFHIHAREVQNEIWTTLQGTLMVWLVDMRQDSPTRGVRRKVVLTGEQPAVLHIPAGVAHGYRAGAQGALLLYAMDAQFDPTNPNEGRIPWDLFGSSLWDEDRGSCSHES